MQRLIHVPFVADDHHRLSQKRAEIKKEKKRVKRAASFHEGSKRSAAQKGRLFISQFAVAHKSKRVNEPLSQKGTGSLSAEDSDNGDGVSLTIDI